MSNALFFDLDDDFNSEDSYKTKVYEESEIQSFINPKLYILGDSIEGTYEIDFKIRVNLEEIEFELESEGYKFDCEDEGGYEFYNSEKDRYKKIFYAYFGKGLNVTINT